MKRGRVQSEPTPARRSARTAATEAAPAQTPIAKRSTRKPSAIALESGAATPPESEPTPHTLVDAPPVAVAPPARGAAAARKGVVGTPTRAVAPALASAAPARSPAAARTAPPAEPAVPKVGEDGLTPYERERLQNLERNRLKMEELGLIGTAMEMAVRQPSAPPPKARGLQPARKKAPVEDVGPARRSLRGQGKTADNRFAAGVHDESADGTVIVMVAGEAIRYKPNMRTDGGAAEAERLARTALASADAPFVSIDSSRRKADADDGVKRAATDAAFIALLASAACSAPAQRADELAAPPSAAPPLSGLLGLGLRDGHVAKVCPRDIVHVAFQPRADSLVLTAADKGGHVAIWDVRRAEASAARAAKAEEAAEAAEASGAPAAAAADDDDDDDDDGVLLLKPHQQYVSGLRWSPGRPSRLFTASYDGTVRCLDLGHAGGSGGGASAFSLVHHSDEHEISAFEVDQAGNVAFFADNRGGLRVIDVRAKGLALGSPSAALSLHDKKVNALSLELSDGVRLASCSTDTTVCVWDTRALGKGAKASRLLGHSKSCQMATWAPDGSGRLLTTCYDDALRVWSNLELKTSSADKAKPSATLTVSHNCNTGRWIVPFRAVWTPGSDGIIVGSMKRQMHVISTATGKLAKAYDSELMTAIPARNAAHPSLPVIAGGTASGRVHIYAK